MDNKPICYVPGKVSPEVYSGVPTFVGIPKISQAEELSDYDVVVLECLGKVHAQPEHGLVVNWGQKP